VVVALYPLGNPTQIVAQTFYCTGKLSPPQFWSISTSLTPIFQLQLSLQWLLNIGVNLLNPDVHFCGVTTRFVLPSHQSPRLSNDFSSSRIHSIDSTVFSTSMFIATAPPRPQSQSPLQRDPCPPTHSAPQAVGLMCLRLASTA
jgi:hypothetical protein